MERKKSEMTTLCYIEKDDCYLMLHRIRKKKDVNKEKWIGVGGHFETGESPEECLLREVKEETGLTLTNYRFRGLVSFVVEEAPEENTFMCLYTADGFEGEIISTEDCEEGVLKWVKKEDIPKLNLWTGDKIFFQLLEEDAPVFSLKLKYHGSYLKEAVLDGKPLELLDIVDEKGNPTGLTQEREIVHRTGELHRTASVWIINKENNGRQKVLLQKRSAGKDAYPGCLDLSSAGHVPAGCDYLESAIRELGEELGICARKEDLRYIGLHSSEFHEIFHGKPFHNREISAVYLYEKQVDIKDLRLQTEEVETVVWMDLEECIEKVTKGDPQFCIDQGELAMVASACGRQGETKKQTF